MWHDMPRESLSSFILASIVFIIYFRKIFFQTPFLIFFFRPLSVEDKILILTVFYQCTYVPILIDTLDLLHPHQIQKLVEL